MTYSRIFIGLSVLLVLAGCGQAPAAESDQGASASIQLAAPDGHVVGLSVELARTAAEQQQGLMGRTSMAYGAGMLFIFPDSVQHSFWMKDTVLPLDIIFFDGEGNVVSMASMEPCIAEADTSCPSTFSDGPARFALEVPKGYLAAAGVGPDWRLVLGPWASR
ncbi:hypothetical protein AUJ46_00945 [Candidatus Peregrinibacteria bacterium CG1_02_54_53]|nr:MAG: hypothetical protein AUJ46_00945 [Candidatus Peregrinibacteria bacterium CG1_02_54_53]